MSEYLPAVPGRSWHEVEQIANDTRARLAPEYGPDCLAVDIEDIAHVRLEAAGIVFGPAELAPGDEGKSIWNPSSQRFELWLSPKAFDDFLRGDRRARMTVAHEIGHLKLHRPQIKAIGEAVNSPHPVSMPGLLRTKESVPSYAHPERQANVFAGRFLLPTQNVRRAIQQLGLNNERDLADAFLVSPRAMSVRLSELGIRLQ